MLQGLLNCPRHPNHKNYKYLPVSTSLDEQLLVEARQLLIPAKQIAGTQDQFLANQSPENVKEALIMLKLKGYIDQRDITGKSTEIKKLPSKIQVGTMIEGDPFKAVKISRKKGSDLVEYFLQKDREAKFTQRKFTELQKINQRKHTLKRKIIKKKQRGKQPQLQ